MEKIMSGKSKTDSSIPPRELLSSIAKKIVLESGGFMEKAAELLDAALRQANNIELERELFRYHRGEALRDELRRAQSDLRAEGSSDFKELRRHPNYSGPTDAFGNVKKWRHPDGHLRTSPPPPPRKPGDFLRESHLDTFKIRDVPIGDYTPEEVVKELVTLERNTRFMRLVIADVPPRGIIRQYVSPEQAAAYWKLASESPAQKPEEPEPSPRKDAPPPRPPRRARPAAG
jgi:hypothetical protein